VVECRQIGVCGMRRCLLLAPMSRTDDTLKRPAKPDST
jgi:hypothetical protein